DGFDNGFPMYEPDPELGTEQELIDGIRKVKEMGVHISFYMNILIHNRKYYTDDIDKKAYMQEDGSVPQVSYGNPAVKFSNMCPNSKLWQDQFCGLVKRAATVYGIDGVYFDQLGCGLKFCFNKEHGHDFDDNNTGYLTMLKRVIDVYTEATGSQLCIMGEWTNDTFSPYVDYQLNQLFFNYVCGGYPEMYRYTFPETGTVDMVYPSCNLAMRPVHVAMKSQQIMGRLFTNGSYLWAYDLEEDNTFDRDPAGQHRLRTINALSKLRKKLMPDALFCDTDGIINSDRPINTERESLYVKNFKGTNGNILSVYALPGSQTTKVKLCSKVTKAVMYTAENSCCELEVKDNTVTVPAETSIIVLS
nr:hypothetical protein [Clostridia bacterium]